MYGDVKYMLLCIKQNIDVTHKTPPDNLEYPGVNALHIASAFNYDIICQVLLETGAFLIDEFDQIN